MRSLKYKIITLVAAALAASLALAQENEKEEKPEAQGNVTWRKGQVERRRAGKDAWGALDKGDSVFLGDVVRTGKSARVEIRLKDKSVLRIDQKSKITLSRFQLEASASSGSEDLLSRVWLKVKKKDGKPSNYEVSTPTAVAGVRGTVLRVDLEKDADDNDVTLVKVYTGKVDVTRPKGPRVEVPGPDEVSKDTWEKIVIEMMGKEQLRIGKSGPLGKVTKFDPDEEKKTDEWARWNQQRDEVEEKGGDEPETP